jgi:hypothetical protein
MEDRPPSIPGTRQWCQLYRPRAWASMNTVMTRPHQLPVVLKVCTDASTAATSAANATRHATIRNLNDPRSEM